MRRITFLLSFCLVSACGGGGGGGVSPGGNAGTSTSSLNSFTYNKLEDLGPGTTVDLASRVLTYRDYDSRGYTVSSYSGMLSGSEASISFIENENGEVGNRFSVNSPDHQIDWAVDLFTESSESSGLGNALDDFIYYWRKDGTLGEQFSIFHGTSYSALGFGYITSPVALAGYLQTQYVVPLIVSMDFGGNCYIIGNCDDDYDEDIWAAVGGDYTVLADMPTSGISYKEAKGIALFHTDEVGRNAWSIKHYLAAESDGEIDVNYADGTITGYLILDAVFRQEYGGTRWLRLEGSNAGTVQIEGTIDGLTASGTVTWGGPNYGSGFFNGAFFGPNGKEFGGVITAMDDLDDEWSQIIVAFVAEDN